MEQITGEFTLCKHLNGAAGKFLNLYEPISHHPQEELPILLLVSEKSTFLNFLKAAFQNNVTFDTNEDFRSQFNSDWTGKLLIMVDEVLLNRREDSERLKNLSTTLSYKE